MGGYVLWGTRIYLDYERRPIWGALAMTLPQLVVIAIVGSAGRIAWISVVSGAIFLGIFIWSCRRRTVTQNPYFGVGGSYSQAAYNRAMQQALNSTSFSYGMLSGNPAESPNRDVRPLPVEDSQEVIRAWRWYTVEPNGLMRGAQATWEADRLHAVCAGGHPIERCIADPKHSCGIYSYRSVSAAGYHHNVTPPAMEVLAEVVNFGVVYQHSEGYRSEWTRIDHLWVIAGTKKLGDASVGDMNPLYLSIGMSGQATTQSSGKLNPIEVERTIARLEERYGVPVDVVTRDEIQAQIDKEDGEAWERLARRPKSYGFRSQPESILDEVARLLPDTMFPQESPSRSVDA